MWLGEASAAGRNDCGSVKLSPSGPTLFLLVKLV